MTDRQTEELLQLWERMARRLEREKATLHARVGHQRRELAAQNRAYWALSRRGSLLHRELVLVREIAASLRLVPVLELQWLSGNAASHLAAACRAELERRKRWEQYGLGWDPNVSPNEGYGVPSLEETG